jgi:hypothetical protein
LGSSLGLGFLSGINLYATVLTIGLGLRFGLLKLPIQLDGLNILSQPPILIIAGILYVIEFLADKIPWVDSMWDTIHTFIRPAGAALIGVVAIGDISPELEFMTILVFGGVGLSSHAAKAGTRLTINQSPEPISNIVISTFEDIFVIIGAWLFITHPIVGLTVVVLFIIAFFWLAPKLYRMLKFQFACIKGFILSLAPLSKSSSSDRIKRTIPNRFKDAVSDFKSLHSEIMCLNCFTGKNCKPGRYYSGILCVSGGMAVFLTKRFFRVRKYEFSLHNIEAQYKHRLFLSQMTFKFTDKQIRFYCTRNIRADLEALVYHLSD